MRTHTALHALCGVVWRDYGAQVTGGNMEPGSGRMDFEFERMSGDLVDTIESTVNAELAAARDVRVAVLPRAEAFAIPDLIRTKINLLPEGIETIRTIEIVGLDLQADGGTHVSNTREVGGIRVTGYESKGRINKRIRISLTTDRVSRRHHPALADSLRDAGKARSRRPPTTRTRRTSVAAPGPGVEVIQRRASSRSQVKIESPRRRRRTAPRTGRWRPAASLRSFAR